MYVVVVFRTPAGRDAEWSPKVIAVHCQKCTAGKHHGGCSHAFTALVALTLLQARQITAGDVGDGAKAWGGANRLSSVPVQSIKCIALLTRSGPLVYFTGFLPDAPPLDDLLEDYITRFQQLASPNTKATIVELHRSRPIVRSAPAPSTDKTERRPRYLQRYDTAVPKGDG